MPVAESIQATPERTGTVRVENRVLLHTVDWETYTKFLEAVGTRRIRLTYDRGTLEIMTISRPHEWWKSRIGFLIRLLGGMMKMKVQPSGSTILRRQDVERGLEPDDAFHIHHAEQMAGPRNLDLTQDPPPDLALEVDISRSSLNRMGIYASLRIPEVWRYDGEALQVSHLQVDGTYVEAQQSLSFPTLPLAEFVPFLHQTEDLSETELIDPFREWVRTHVLSRGQGADSQDTGNGA
jgi:Uma2 family endonuclease